MKTRQKYLSKKHLNRLKALSEAVSRIKFLIKKFNLTETEIIQALSAMALLNEKGKAFEKGIPLEKSKVIGRSHNKDL